MTEFPKPQPIGVLAGARLAVSFQTLNVSMARAFNLPSLPDHERRLAVLRRRLAKIEQEQTH